MARTAHSEREKATERLRIAREKLTRTRATFEKAEDRVARFNKAYDEAVDDVERLQVEVESLAALVEHYAAHPALVEQPTLDES